MEWLGIPWWVWVFVVPEVIFGVIFVVFVLPVAAVSSLRQRRRQRRAADDAGEV